MSINIALSGLQAASASLNTISNNIANAATVGFKSSRSEFASVYNNGTGGGVNVAKTSQNFDLSGSMTNTNRQLDLAIQGNGFYMLRQPDGSQIYSKAGMFSQNSDGHLVDNAGNHLQGYLAGVDGSISTGSVGDMRINRASFPAKATTKISETANLDTRLPIIDIKAKGKAFDASNSNTYSSSSTAPVFDSLGNEHILTQYFVKVDNNVWQVHYTLDDQPPVTAVEAAATAAKIAVTDATDPTDAEVTNAAKAAVNAAVTATAAATAAVAAAAAVKAAAAEAANPKLAEDATAAQGALIAADKAAKEAEEKLAAAAKNDPNSAAVAKAAAAAAQAAAAVAAQEAAIRAAAAAPTNENAKQVVETASKALAAAVDVAKITAAELAAMAPEDPTAVAVAKAASDAAAAALAPGDGTVDVLPFTKEGLIAPVGITAEDDKLRTHVIHFNLNNGSDPLNLSLDFSRFNQFAESFSTSAMDQNGYASGEFIGLRLDETGHIFGKYSNNKERVQGQILLADFNNPDGLIPNSNNSWEADGNSGQAILGIPLSGNFGKIKSGYLESSNVDTTSEMVKLMEAQRNYQGNAKFLEIEKRMSQTILNAV